MSVDYHTGTERHVEIEDNEQMTDGPTTPDGPESRRNTAAVVTAGSTDLRGGDGRFLLLLGQAWDLHRLKASHYGTKTDPLANLRVRTWTGTTPFKAVLGELENVHTRLVNLFSAYWDGEVVDQEELLNALMDNQAWSLLAIILGREEHILDQGKEESPST